MSKRAITTYKVFNAEAISKKGVATSSAIDSRRSAQNGIFSIAYVTTAGSLTFSYTVCTTKDGTYFTPTGAESIASGVTVGTGGYSFSPPAYPFMKLVATEADSAATVLTLHLNVA